MFCFGNIIDIRVHFDSIAIVCIGNFLVVYLQLIAAAIVTMVIYLGQQLIKTSAATTPKALGLLDSEPKIWNLRLFAVLSIILCA